MEVPTVKIVVDSGFAVINESDYDPSTMKLYEESPPKRTTKKTEEVTE